MNFEIAIQRLCDSGFDFVVIGGWAAIFHGSAYVTNDLDICYSRDRNNLTKLAHARAPSPPPRLSRRPSICLGYRNACRRDHLHAHHATRHGRPFSRSARPSSRPKESPVGPKTYWSCRNSKVFWKLVRTDTPHLTHCTAGISTTAPVSTSYRCIRVAPSPSDNTAYTNRPSPDTNALTTPPAQLLI